MILDIFKTSIFKTNINNQDYYNYFINELNNSFIKNEGKIKSNAGGFQTNNLNNDKIFSELFLEPVMTFLNFFKTKKNFKLNNFVYWINKNSFGNYNKPHYHGNNCISGVYYLEVPEKSGALVFQNSDNLKWDSTLFNIFEDSNFHGSYTICPKKFDLILFFSETIHYVEPNLSNQDRISVAFNICIKNE
jgi:uncharacterized protein (TIGR02466 family)